MELLARGNAKFFDFFLEGAFRHVVLLNLGANRVDLDLRANLRGTLSARQGYSFAGISHTLKTLKLVEIWTIVPELTPVKNRQYDSRHT